MFKAATIAILLAVTSATVLAHSFVKRDGDHAHDHRHEPSSGYEEPDIGYKSPSASYGTPAYSYEALSTSYGVDEPSYEPSYLPSYDSYHQVFPDLTPILIAVLALIGLSLMFPNNVRIDSVRKKRSAAEGKIKGSITNNPHDLY